MSAKKPKDHLFELDMVVRSVLYETTAKSECGLEKTFTRSDFELREYGDTCGKCVAEAAGKVTPEAMSILPKLGWTALLEKAFMERCAASMRPRVQTWTWNTNAATAYKFTGKKWSD